MMTVLKIVMATNMMKSLLCLARDVLSRWNKKEFYEL